MAFEIVLLASYELGHQPINLAWPQAFLERAGFTVNSYDLSVADFPSARIKQAELVAVSAPMHTALRLGVETAKRVRLENPKAHIAFYGLYAYLNRYYLLGNAADSILSGEHEDALVSLARALETQSHIPLNGVTSIEHSSSPSLDRLDFPVPARASLPPLNDYAHYMHKGSHQLAGYTEASRGCLHTCAHCPIVPVYQGRFFVVDMETVLADIRQQVQAGAKHITFGDPDFLNAPTHAVRITQALHNQFPGTTYSFTAKVEHISEHAGLLDGFASTGCTFIVCAFESTSDQVLSRLGKGHTREHMSSALELARAAGISLNPTWMPFTPWTSLDDYLELLEWIREHELIASVPAVQLSIRMLVPPESALLDHSDVSTWCGALDAENFNYRWVHPDPRMDSLQLQIAALAEEHLESDPVWVFRQIEYLAYTAAGTPAPQWPNPAYKASTPKLTEHWYC